jgi:SAM-dependent methyltransferase
MICYGPKIIAILAVILFIGMQGQDKQFWIDNFNKYHLTCKESVSGPGSDLRETVVIRKELPSLLKKFGIETMLDAACGDFNWMKEISLPLKKYIGIEVVGELVKINQERYGSDIRKFFVADIETDVLPKVDLILCRDCFIHYDFATTKRIIENFKRSGSKYLLTTTFTRRTSNTDTTMGGFLPLNLQEGPFFFPEPILIINEMVQPPWYYADFSDKSLGLWLLADL